MTSPEWRNVEMAEEYYQFLESGNSLFQFPYFKQLWDLWGTTFKAFNAARKYNGFFEVLTSEYMAMGLFVPLFTTFELLPKAILSLLFYPVLGAKNDTEMQKHLAEFYKKYAQDIRTIPFYDHDYASLRNDLADKYSKCEKISWIDWFSWTCVSLELRARRWISAPFSYFYHQDGSSTPAETEVLVKCRLNDVFDEDTAKEQFKATLARIENVSLASDATVHFKPAQNNKAYSTIYTRLSVPRYEAFMQTVSDLKTNGIDIRKIAGQDRVQLKCAIDAPDADALEKTQSRVNEQARQQPLYVYGDRIKNHRRICLFDIPVKDIAERQDELNHAKNARVTFIHNF